MSHPTGLAGLVELGRRPDLSGYRVALVFAAGWLYIDDVAVGFCEVTAKRLHGARLVAQPSTDALRHYPLILL